MAIAVRDNNGAMLQYTFPANCWPKYKYFQKRLLRLTPRFKRILDIGNLSKQDPKSPAHYKELLQFADEFASKVRVTVFCDSDMRDKPLASTLVINKVGDTEDKNFVSIGLNGFLEHIEDKRIEKVENNAEIIVFVFKNETQVFLRSLENSLSSKSSSTLSKMFFLQEESNVSFTFTELKKNNFKIPLSVKETSLSTLSSKIQDKLEQRVVSVFDELAQFITKIESDTKGEIKFHTQTNDTPTAVEQETLKIIETLKKLKFEIFGLLRKKSSKVELYTTVPPIHTISRELQMDLLKIPEIIGCGLLFDELVLHVSHSFQKSSEKRVTGSLKKYNYEASYRIETVEEIGETKCAKGSEVIAKFTDQESKAKYINEKGENEPEPSDSLFGALGCFVIVQKQENNGRCTTSLHGLTCAHCIMHCHPEITIKDCLTKDEILARSSKRKTIYLKNCNDIAAIKIHKKDESKCDKALLHDDEDKSDNIWTFGDNVPDQCEGVYKFGPKTKLTRGLIVSNNYVVNEVKKKHRNDVIKHKNSMMIEHEDMDQGDSFSEEGDSGSVVCLEDSETHVTRAVALIHGSLVVENKETKVLHKYSLAFPIKDSIDMLKRRLTQRYGVIFTILPARNEDS